MKRERLAERTFFVCVLAVLVITLAASTSLRTFRYFHERGLLLNAERVYHKNQEDWLRRLVENDKLRSDADTQREELSKHQGLVREGEETIYPRFDRQEGAPSTRNATASN